MAASEYLKDLDPKFAEALERATDSLRREFEEKLDGIARELRGEAAGEQEAVVDDLVAETDAADAADTADAADAADAPAQPVPDAYLDPIEELKHAVAAVDSAQSQGEILTHLIAGCTRFASRAAIFLVRDDEVHGWGSHGFGLTDEELRGVRFAIAEGSPWQNLSAGPGALALDPQESGSVCSELSADPAQMGFLLPFILGNQVAAGVYCDQVEGDEAPRLSALQILTFVASQVLENLPVRDRPDTATLRLAGVVTPETTETDEVDQVEEAAAEEEAEPVEEAAAEEAPEVEPVEEPAEEEAEELEPEEVELEAAEEEPLETDHDATQVLPPTEVILEPAIESEPVEEDEAEEAEEPEMEPAEEPEPEAEPEAEPEEIDEPAEEEEAGEPEEAAAVEEEEPAEEEAEAEASATPAPAPGTPTQVNVPDDLQGPGWAFSSSQGAEPPEEARHEEARRLARLLVTEIKLYNEEAVEQGRQQGDVYAALRDDIDRSRQIFDERIDEAIRNEQDYFREALLRILAGGDEAVLGT